MKHLARFFEPEGFKTATFQNADGKKIRYGHAVPKGDVKGTVVITTGYADFIEAYHETIHAYLDRGYAVWIMDWAGQGGSDKKSKSNHGVLSAENHVRDLKEFRDKIVTPIRGKPVFLSTHSMGGQIALHYLHDHPRDFDAAILAAPLVDYNLPGTEQSLMRAAFKTVVEAGSGHKTIPGGRRGMIGPVTDERNEIKKQDPVRLELHRTFMLLNPELKTEDPSFSFIHSLYEMTERSQKESFLKKIKTPVLIMKAEIDKYVNNAAMSKAASLMPAAKHVVIPKAIHGLWLERDPIRQDVWHHVDAFLKEQHVLFDRKRNLFRLFFPKGPR